jgi:NADPH:quinone reductase
MSVGGGTGGYASVYIAQAPVVVSTAGYDIDPALAVSVIVDPVGGDVRTRSLDLLAPGGRLLVAGNASGDGSHQIGSNHLWLGSITVSGFNPGAYLPAHPQVIRPALEAALAAVAAGQGETVVDVLPFTAAAVAHERMESRALNGRIVLTPNS